MQTARMRNHPGRLRSLDKSTNRPPAMITEAKKQEVIAAIEQLQDEQLLAQIEELLKTAEAAPRKRLREPGFAKDTGFWMADDFDEPLEDMKDYM